LTPEQRSYVRKESAISVAINAALSAVFAFIVFGGPAYATVEDIAFDAFPQSFMIALMSTLVPTAITRQRLRAGTVQPLAGGAGFLPNNLILRALIVAAGAALVGGALHWLLLPSLAPPLWAFAAVLIYKVAYGALLATAIAPFILRRALADVQANRTEPHP
jgi:hypothetical protein